MEHVESLKAGETFWESGIPCAWTKEDTRLKHRKKRKKSGMRKIFVAKKLVIKQNRVV